MLLLDTTWAAWKIPRSGIPVTDFFFWTPVQNVPEDAVRMIPTLHCQQLTYNGLMIE